MREKSDALSEKVKDFYNLNPFPDFDINKYSTLDDLKEQAGWFFRLLDFYIPGHAKIIDTGCGTGQLTCLLAAQTREVLGIDFSENSLKKAELLKQKLNLSHVRFQKNDLFKLGLPEESFDYTFCCGVLHHTPDPYLGFKNLVKITKNGGFIIIGLYNRYGRLFLRIRRLLLRHFSKNNLKRANDLIKKQVGKTEVDQLKINSWLLDQYLHPYESVCTIAEALWWFSATGVTYVNSFPSIELFKNNMYDNYIRFQPNPFTKSNEKRWQTNRFALFLKQLQWIITLRDAGGYFIIIGQKQRSD